MNAQLTKLFAAVVLSSAWLLPSCAEVKEAGRTIGHTTRDVTREIGHGTRDAVKEIGHGTRRVVKSIGDESPEGVESPAEADKHGQ
jgi:hypothetical protein